MITYLIALYIIICALVGTIGMGRQIGFFLAFFISLITTPVIGLIITALSSKNKVEVSIENQPNKETVTDELIKLNDLKEKGIITEDEFLKQKNRILN